MGYLKKALGANSKLFLTSCKIRTMNKMLGCFLLFIAQIVHVQWALQRCNQITGLFVSYGWYFKVLIRIDEAMSNLDDPDILTEILLQTGAFHKKIPGFKPEMFWVSERKITGSEMKWNIFSTLKSPSLRPWKWLCQIVTRHRWMWSTWSWLST